jgi:predicted nuclease of predicted toxin-antitoxin system
LAASIRLYLDECLTPVIAQQLRHRGIDAVAVHELGLTGDSDANHLSRAWALGRVLVTADTDFLVMAADGEEHAGIVFGSLAETSVGDWVRALELLCNVYSQDDMINHVEYI